MCFKAPIHKREKSGGWGVYEQLRARIIQRKTAVYYPGSMTKHVIFLVILILNRSGNQNGQLSGVYIRQAFEDMLCFNMSLCDRSNHFYTLRV